MKVTTKVMAVLWALVLACLWLPQVTLAGYCPDSGNCCETDADCAGVDEECLDPFGVCQDTGEFCDADLDCGSECSAQTWKKDCTDGASCGLACSEPPHIVCVQDENCVGETNVCAPQTCEPTSDCVMEPEATGRCEDTGGGGAETPCAADGACPEDEYCVRPGECNPSGDPCQAGLPTGICSIGDFVGQPCRADAECAHCSGGGAVACDNDSDCRACSITQTACFTTGDCLNKVCEGGPNWAGLYCFDEDDCNGNPCVTQTCDGADCIADAICLMPHAPEGLCNPGGNECQDSGDCDGGTCVFSGSCTAGQCAVGGLPCATDPDCGTHCEDTMTTGCTTNEDCGLSCDGIGDSCEVDADCGLACTESGIEDCTTDADCRTTCWADDVDTGWACPDTNYCQTQPVGNPAAIPCDGATTCECKLIADEACEPIAECTSIEGNDCVNDMACNINTGCTTAVEQRCTNNRWTSCEVDDTCAGCLIGGDTCAGDGDCPDRCSVSGEACTDSCPKVCSDDPSVECVINADCTLPGLGTCVTQTCNDNYCAGTCEPAYVCQEVATQKCGTRPCTRDVHCADLGAEAGDYTCTGDMDCCTGTCGNLAQLPDPQCGTGDCESCYAPACLDGDNDGYGDPGNGECFNGATLDCNDDNAAVNPGATEDLSDPASCADTIDNNCNGLIDAEEPGCIPTSTCAGSASASTGPAGTGGNNSGWYLLLLAGVVLIGVSAKRVFGHK